jgi:hypothetical protein
VSEGGKKEWTTTFLDGLGLAVMMAGGRRRERCKEKENPIIEE